MDVDLTASQDLVSQGMDMTQLGDKLVDQPNKVKQIDINYARTAKKMDVKKLKSSMWKLLVQPEKDTDKVKRCESVRVLREKSNVAIHLI